MATVVAFLMIGCADGDRNGIGAGNPERNVAESKAVSADAESPVEENEQRSKTLVFFGTSLTAGYGLPPVEAYPALIQERIDRAGLPWRVVNAGVNGETSAGALRRIDWVLRQPVDVLVIETGANDMLRGTGPDATEANIQAIVDRVRAARPGTRILLAEMRALPNLGREYTDAFEAIYPRVAERNGLTLVPFLLAGVAGEARLNQADGVHPTAEGQAMVAENIWTTIEPLLREETEDGADGR